MFNDCWCLPPRTSDVSLGHPELPSAATIYGRAIKVAAPSLDSRLFATRPISRHKGETRAALCLRNERFWNAVATEMGG